MSVQKKVYYSTPPVTRVRAVLRCLKGAGAAIDHLLKARLASEDRAYIQKVQYELESLSDSLRRNLITRYKKQK